MYIVQEIQTTNNATILVPAAVFSDKNQAESAYHQALCSSAISSVDVHTVILYNEHGVVLKAEYYEHNEL